MYKNCSCFHSQAEDCKIIIVCIASGIAFLVLSVFLAMNAMREYTKCIDLGNTILSLNMPLLCPVLIFDTFLNPAESFTISISRCTKQAALAFNRTVLSLTNYSNSFCNRVRKICYIKFKGRLRVYHG